MATYNCIIIDDEELARDLLENFVSRIDHLKLRGKFSSPIQALNSLKEESIDIVFLDIQMPEMTGIEFLKTLSISPAIIFTTAYDKYALAGYEYSVVDYLLKPFSFTRFVDATNKATELIDLKKGRGDNVSLKTDSIETLTVKADYKIHRIRVNDLVFIESKKEYVVYHTQNDKIMALGSLKALEETLPNTEFIRVHKSFIVSIHHVKSVEGNELNLGKVRIPIGGTYKEKAMKALF